MVPYDLLLHFIHIDGLLSNCLLREPGSSTTRASWFAILFHIIALSIRRGAWSGHTLTVRSRWWTTFFIIKAAFWLRCRWFCRFLAFWWCSCLWFIGRLGEYVIIIMIFEEIVNIVIVITQLIIIIILLWLLCFALVCCLLVISHITNALDSCIFMRYHAVIISKSYICDSSSLWHHDHSVCTE